jgi:DNA-binding Xre family transcriptional regulator
VSDLIERIAKNIRKYRKGMSLKTISQKSGIPFSTINTIYYKHKIKDVQVSTLLAVAKALNVSLDELIE